ncbi:MAG TPA: hypothetical protein VN812_06475 [Candidatus Acidoferrales bacterium]|nr:hypothetical protein [Candidatus Acidoferrales bacterium]
MAAFERTHQAYVNSDAKVQQADADVAKTQAQLHADHADVVDMLARAQVADGQPLRKPFGAIGGSTPAALLRLSPEAAVKPLSDLIAAMRRSKTTGKATLQVLPGVDKLVHGLEQGRARLDALRAAALAARNSRDALAPTWDADLGALKRGARAAADDGAPTLYAALFDRPKHAAAKTPKPTPEPPTPPAVATGALAAS